MSTIPNLASCSSGNGRLSSEAGGRENERAIGHRWLPKAIPISETGADAPALPALLQMLGRFPLDLY